MLSNPRYGLPPPPVPRIQAPTASDSMSSRVISRVIVRTGPLAGGRGTAGAGGVEGDKRSALIRGQPEAVGIGRAIGEIFRATFRVVGIRAAHRSARPVPA